MKTKKAKEEKKPKANENLQTVSLDDIPVFENKVTKPADPNDEFEEYDELDDLDLD